MGDLRRREVREQILKVRHRKKSADLSPTMSIIILNINRLNTIIKEQLLLDCVKKQDSMDTVYKRHISHTHTQPTNRLDVTDVKDKMMEMVAT